MRKTLATILMLAIVTTGCASRSQPKTPNPSQRTTDTSVLAQRLWQLPQGTKVRIDRLDGTRLEGKLVTADREKIYLWLHGDTTAPALIVPLAAVDRVTNIERFQLPKAIGKRIARAVVDALVAAALTIDALTHL